MVATQGVGLCLVQPVLRECGRHTGSRVTLSAASVEGVWSPRRETGYAKFPRTPLQDALKVREAGRAKELLYQVTMALTSMMYQSKHGDLDITPTLSMAQYPSHGVRRE